MSDPKDQLYRCPGCDAWMRYESVRREDYWTCPSCCLFVVVLLNHHKFSKNIIRFFRRTFPGSLSHDYERRETGSVEDVLRAYKLRAFE